MTAPSNVTLHCAHGMHKHTHVTFEELDACVARYKFYAKPREVKQLIALGVPETVAREVPESIAKDVIAKLLARKADHARQRAGLRRTSRTHLPF